MQKRYILFFLFFGFFICLSPNLLHAQNDLNLAQKLLEDSIDLQKKGMLVLGSWATLNLVSGVYGFYNTQGDRQYFHQMNAAWNLVNLGIAGIGLYGALHSDLVPGTAEALAELQKFDRILLINAGLDVLYVGTGAWLWKKGIRDNSDRLLGYGKSIVLQGGFLLLFDLSLYLLHHPNTSGLVKLSNSLAVGPSGLKISF